MDMNFDGKTVIITGASAGVGAACARAFASLKANLVLVARGQEGLNVISDDLSKYCEIMTCLLYTSPSPRDY